MLALLKYCKEAEAVGPEGSEQFTSGSHAVVGWKLIQRIL